MRLVGCLKRKHSNTISHPRLGRPSGLFSAGFPTKTLYVFLFSLPPHPPSRATYTAQLIVLDVINLSIIKISGENCEL